MTQIGEIALVIALILAVYSSLAVVIGARRSLPELVTSGRWGILTVCGLATIASAALWYAFFTRDFQVAYVYQYSSRGLSTFYTVSAFWAGQSGSLLLWLWVLAIFGVVVVFQTRKRNTELSPYVLLIIGAMEVFFLWVLNFGSPPFARLEGVPPDGNGLNPM